LHPIVIGAGVPILAAAHSIVGLVAWTVLDSGIGVGFYESGVTQPISLDRGKRLSLDEIQVLVPTRRRTG
jgi:hypothetical protein